MVSLHWADYIIVVTLPLVTVAVGLYHAFVKRRQRTTEEFIIGDRTIKIIPLAISLIVTNLSAIGILNDTPEIYTRGIMPYVGSLITSLIAVLLISQIIIPWLHSLKLLSINTYFLRRYANFKWIALLNSVLGILAGLLWSGVAIFGTSLAFQTATDISYYITIPVGMGMAVLFTSLGGLQAVVWTDVFQFVVMLGGTLAILIKAVTEAGGFHESFATLDQQGRVFIEISPDPTVLFSIWAFIFGSWIHTTGFFGLSQNPMQRFTAAPTVKAAKKIPFMSYAGYLLMNFVTTMTGVAVVAFYAQKKCDPFASGQIHKANQMLPYFVKQAFEGVPGVMGLFLATLISSTISTISSNLSGISANAYEDVYKPFRPQTTEQRGKRVVQILVVLWGLLIIGIAFAVHVAVADVPILQITVSLTSICRSPPLAMFILGGLKIFRKIRAQAVLVGGLCGFVINAWIYFGSMTVKGKHPWLPPVPVEGCDVPVNVTATTHPDIRGLRRFYTVSFLWFPLICVLVTVLFAVITSKLMDLFMKQAADDDVPDDLFIKFPCTCRRHKHNVIAITDDCGQEMEEASSQDKYSILATNGDVVGVNNISFK